MKNVTTFDDPKGKNWPSIVSCINQARHRFKSVYIPEKRRTEYLCMVCKFNYATVQCPNLSSKLINDLLALFAEEKERVLALRPAPKSYDLKKDSPEWYNLALQQWSEQIDNLKFQTQDEGE